MQNQRKKIMQLLVQNERLICTSPSKPLVSAPFSTESDISAIAANSTLDPAVLNCKAIILLIVLVGATAVIHKKILDSQFFPDHQSSVLSPRNLCHKYIY